MSTKALSSIVPGGSAAGSALGLPPDDAVGRAGPDAGFALATAGLGSAVMLNVILWVGLIVSIPMRGVNTLYGTAAVAGIIIMGGAAALVFGLMEGAGRAERVLRWIARKFGFNEDRAGAAVRQVGGRLEDLAADRQLLVRVALLGGGELVARRGVAVGVPARVRPGGRPRRADRRLRPGQRAGGHPDHARAASASSRASTSPRWSASASPGPRPRSASLSYRFAQYWFPIVARRRACTPALRVRAVEHRAARTPEAPPRAGRRRPRPTARARSTSPPASAAAGASRAVAAHRRRPTPHHRPLTPQPQCAGAEASTPEPPGTPRSSAPDRSGADARLTSVGRMTTHERPFGRYLEDFVVGDVYRHWPGKTITEYDDHLFCMITMNHHPLHTNDWFAAQSVQGRNVVVGNLVYSLVLGMSVPDVSGAAIANLEVETLQHKFPTFHGDTIHAETRVLDVQESKSKNDRGIVTVETKGFNQDGKEVCYFRRRVMVWKREFAPQRPRPYDGDTAWD